MELKDAFKELARFAEARARGATVKVMAPDGAIIEYGDHTQKNGSIPQGTGPTPFAFMAGWRIKEIIEPTVLRDWTAEDAKKHIGYAFRFRNAAEVSIITRHHGVVGNSEMFAPSEYATPIPGTDPAKWDWKPCKVEVPVPAVKPVLDVAATLRKLIDDIKTESVAAWPDIYVLTGIVSRLDAIIKNTEQS